MARDPVRVLQTLRQRSIEQARFILATCLKAEADAVDRIDALDAAAERDRNAHQVVENAYLYQEMFSRRIQANRSERQGADSILLALQARSAEARAALAAARTAAEAVDTLIADRTAAEQAEADRREQHVMDDMARRR